MVLVTHDHYDHNNVKAIKGDPFIIDGPGEYEYQGIRVYGIPSFHDAKEGDERGLNTVYKVIMEDVKLCHMGDIGQNNLDENQIESLGDIDVLMVPVGGKFTVDANGAVEIVNQLQPRVVIPMHYKVKNLDLQLDGVDKFLNEIGHKGEDTQDKFTFKNKDLPDERMDVVVLNS